MSNGTRKSHSRESAALQKVETLGVSIRENHDKLQSRVSSLTSKVNNLPQENENLQSKLNSLSSQTVQSTTSYHSALDTVNELEDHNRRKCDLIIHKLPENSKDKDTFSSICKDVLGLDVQVLSIKHLGQQCDWPCLLLVVLESEDIKRQILARSPRLSQCDS